VLCCRHFRENLERREGKRGREVKFSGGNKVIELGDKWVSLPFVIPTMKGSTSHTHTHTHTNKREYFAPKIESFKNCQKCHVSMSKCEEFSPFSLSNCTVSPDHNKDQKEIL
jgi:hypothetical protein